MSIRAGISQKQTAGMSPDHIVGKAVLKMGLQELQEYVQQALTENPALSLAEDTVCLICGSALIAGTCITCGASVCDETEFSKNQDDEWSEGQWTVVELPEDDYEPFAAVATPSSLVDHLKQQIRAHFAENDIAIAEFVVDSLDEDGYLREPLFDMAAKFGLSVPQFREVLDQVQELDPPGIAATCLQECLLIQLRHLGDNSIPKSRAEMIIQKCWDDVSRMKLDHVAKELDLTREDVLSVLAYIRDKLNPHPACMFTDPWQRMAPRRDPKIAPDVVIRNTEAGFVVDIIDPISSRITLDEMYASLYAEMSRKRKGFSETDGACLREQVQSARALIEALEFRHTSLRIIADELFRCQAEFFSKGSAYLKPLTRKELAAKVGLHESTVCRATDGKTIQLQTGEVITFDTLFDAALPVKEMVRKLSFERIDGKPLSDGQIAERLQSEGIQIARRTVAKYRDEMRVLPVDYRNL